MFLWKSIGRGVVTSDYYYDDNQKDYKNFRKVNWINNGQWPHPGKAVVKILTDITKYTDDVEKLNVLFETDDEETNEEKEIVCPEYNQNDF